MISIPEKIKELFLSNNLSLTERKKIKLIFYDDTAETLYPHDLLFPADVLFPEDHDAPWLVIENNRIDSESLVITETLSEGEDLEFGSCNSSVFEIIVADVAEDVTGREFTATIEIGGYEMILGIYTVESFARQADRRKRKITAYDRMRNFDIDVSEWYNELFFPMTLKKFRDSLCSYIGISQSEQTLIFDSMQISKTIDPEQISGLDILKAICQINGCFGHIERTGELKYIKLQQTGLFPSNDLFPDNELYPSGLGGDGNPVENIQSYRQGMIYEDYLVQGIGSIIIRQQEGDIGANFGEGRNPYLIEGNFLVYGKNAVELLNIAQSLLPVIEGRTYRPAKIECNAMPWVEVGDAYRAVTRDDIVESFVMKRVISGSQSMKDSIESTGTKKREETFGVNKQIKQLEGKSAVIIKNVGEVSARVTDLKAQEESHFEITSSRITAEVKRAQEVEAALKIEADRISLDVTNFKKDTNARFELTDEAIKTKVTRGTISSEISQEAGKITISSNRLIVDSTNFKLDGRGNAKFTGEIAGGTINIGNGVFVVDSSGKVTAKNIDIDGIANQNTIGCKTIISTDTSTKTLNLNDGTIDDCGTAYIDSLNSIKIWCSNDIECRRIYSTYAGEWWSDSRLKHDIENISPEEAAILISSLKPVSFRMNNGNFPGMGFIAQEVKEICDDNDIKLPLYGEREGYYTIPYTNYIPLLVSAIQDIQKQLNDFWRDKLNESSNL